MDNEIRPTQTSTYLSVGEQLYVQTGSKVYSSTVSTGWETGTVTYPKQEAGTSVKIWITDEDGNSSTVKTKKIYNAYLSVTDVFATPTSITGSIDAASDYLYY